MKLKRIFYPIGHGGFSEEVFYKSNEKVLSIVYDCGTNKKDLIDNVFDKREEEYNKMSIKDTSIDLVFISHYHSDHINILQKLNEKYNMKNIILPLISDVERLYYLMEILVKENYNFKNKNEFIFIDNLFNPNIKDINIIYYMAENEEYEEYEDSNYSRYSDYIHQAKDIEEIDIRNIDKSIRIISNQTILKHSCIWEDIPFYRRNSNITDIFIGDLNTKFEGLIDIHNYNSIDINLLFENIIEIKKYYRSIKKDIIDTNGHKYNPHKNNMTLYSGPIDKKAKDKKKSCLYTGDIHNTNKIINELIDFYENKGVFQEESNTLVWPHHGSCSYYNDLLHKKFKEFIIFADKKGKYSKTNPCKTVRHFIDDIPNIHWVDEEKMYVDEIKC